MKEDEMERWNHAIPDISNLSSIADSLLFLS